MAKKRWDKSLLNSILENKNFLFVILFSLFTSFFFILCWLRFFTLGDIFADFSYFIESYYFVVFHLILLLAVTLLVHHHIKGNSFLMGRFLNRNDLIRWHLKINLKVSIIFISISLLLALAILLFIDFTSFQSTYIDLWNTDSIIYFCYCILRYFAFSLILSTINTLLFYWFNEKFVMLGNILFYSLLFIWAYFLPSWYISGFGFVPVLIINLFSPMGYENFFVDIIYTTSYFFLMCSIVCFLISTTIRKIRDVIE